MRHYSVQPHLIKMDPTFFVYSHSLPIRLKSTNSALGTSGSPDSKQLPSLSFSLCQRLGKSWKPNIILFQDTDWMGKYTLNKKNTFTCALSFIDWMFPVANLGVRHIYCWLLTQVFSQTLEAIGAPFSADWSRRGPPDVDRQDRIRIHYYAR